MILESWSIQPRDIRSEQYDLCLYGLGFETRSPFISGLVLSKRVVALQMPTIDIHSFARNIAFANTRKHHIVSDLNGYLNDELPVVFSKKPSVSIAFDISSLNRIMMLSVIRRLSEIVRPLDRLDVYYCPAAYSPPDWNFPQIEQIGPVGQEFTAFDAQSDLPICVIMGLGFEPGVSMGIINQLEPRLSYCFWGSGIDSRFDSDVKKANFDFEFPGFATRSVAFPMRNPKSAYFLLESLTAGLLDRYNIIFVPMGPKLFALLSGLIALTYQGKLAVWRVQQRRSSPRDAKPGAEVIVAKIDTVILSALATTPNS